MKKRFPLGVILAVTVILLVGSTLPSSAKGSTGACGYNVTSIVADTDVNANAFQFQSDGLGAYVTYTKSKTDSVSSVIQENSCDWVLAMSTAASRGVAYTFALTNQASNPLAPPPFTGPQIVTNYLISKCHLNTANNGVTFGTMTFVGQTAQCGISTLFSYGGNQYSLKMEPVNFPGTYWAQVTCTGVTSISPAQCNAWTVTPQAGLVTNPSTGQVSSIGELVKVTTSKGQQVYTSMGLYYVAFYITIHQ